MAPRERLSEKGNPRKVFLAELRTYDAIKQMFIKKSLVKRVSWLWTSFEYTIGVTKDDAGVRKEAAVSPGKSF